MLSVGPVSISKNKINSFKGVSNIFTFNLHGFHRFVASRLVLTHG